MSVEETAISSNSLQPAANWSQRDTARLGCALVTILVSIGLLLKRDDSTPFFDRLLEGLYFTTVVGILAGLGVGFAMWSFRLEGIRCWPALLSIFVNGGFVIYAVDRLSRILL